MEWIDATKEKPKEAMYVWIADLFENVCLAWYVDAHDAYQYKIGSLPYNGVAYWMPYVLPKPPKHE